MTPSNQTVSERASFDAFFNCYLREVIEGRWHAVDEWRRHGDSNWAGRGQFVIEVPLPKNRLRLAVEILYRSQAGRHRSGLVKLSYGNEWQTPDLFWVLLLLARELTDSFSNGSTTDLARTHATELVIRLAQSQQLMTTYLGTRRNDAAFFGDEFIQSEQSLLYGHWLHPTPKSRQGAADWQQSRFAPELKGQFPLHYFAVQQTHVRQESSHAKSADALIAELLCTMGCGPIVKESQARGECLVPLHPLQAEWVRAQAHVQRALSRGSLRDLGAVGDLFTATSSVRTVYRQDCDWMLKFSVPLKITNSLRVNQAHELSAGVLMSRAFSKMSFKRRHSQFRLLSDPAYMSVQFDGAPRPGFDVILRENPFKTGSNIGVHCVASLVQEPLPHRPSRLRTLLEGLALIEGRNIARVSIDWFKRYLWCSIEPALRLYDDFGVALEAHQQNALLDVSVGYPTRAYFRDNQGYYLSASLRQRLLLLEPRLATCPELFYDDSLIQERFSYYLIGNQLFSVIWRLGCDGLLDEDEALTLVARRLEALRREFTGPAAPLVEALLESPTLSHKANLLTRVCDIDELTAVLEQAVYTRVRNPIALTAQQRITEEAIGAVA